MKKNNLYRNYSFLAVVVAVLLQVGCSKEKGFHDVQNTNQGTSLNTYEYLKSKPGVYDSLLLLIDKLKMQSVLQDSTVTLFAPSNSSFRIALNNLNNARKIKGQPSVFLNELASGIPRVPAELAKSRDDSMHVDTMVSQYIIKGIFRSTDFSAGDGRAISSVRGDYPMHAKRLYADAQGMQNGGSEVIQFANTRRSVFVPNWSLTTTNSVNITTKNGIVHLLEPEHVFGFNQFTTRLTFIPPPPSLFVTYAEGSTWSIKFEDPNAVDGSVDAGEKFIKSLDGNLLTKFIAVFNAGNNKVTMNWVAPIPVVSNAYSLATANDSAPRDPKSWIVEGSNDGTSWVRLDSRQDITWQSRYQRKVFDFPNTTPYKYYRMQILANSGDGTLMQLSEWTMNYRAPVL